MGTFFSTNFSFFDGFGRQILISTPLWPNKKIHFIYAKCPKEAKMASPLEPKNYQFVVQKRQKNVKII